jgi:ParB/Sulfiredoxin domain
METQNIDITEIRSYWYSDILKEWQPDRQYIEYLKDQIKQNAYIAPIVVVRENGGYTVVNGHHRYYAHLSMGSEYIKGIVIEGTFEDSEPLRKAEGLLKILDRKTEYKYCFSYYLDHWAASVDNHEYVSNFQLER